MKGALVIGSSGLLGSALVKALQGTNRQAWAAYQALLADDRIVLRSEEPAGLEALWRRFAVRGTASPKLWMDAYLAAFALSGGFRMVTTDAAFKQLGGLDLELLG